jgi:hypothetical protein
MGTGRDDHNFGLSLRTCLKGNSKYKEMKAQIFLALVSLNSLVISVTGQDNWQLRKNKDGIQAYSSQFPGSKIQAIKVVATFDATPGQIASKVMDINTASEWVSNLKTTYVTKRVSANELYYYAEISLPWPVSNRDFVAHLTMSEDTTTGAITIDGPVVENMVPEKKGIVRINNSTGRWIITPDGTNHVTVEYSVHVDPAGSLPTWLINMVSTKTPIEIFEKLRLLLKQPAYMASSQTVAR